MTESDREQARRLVTRMKERGLIGAEARRCAKWGCHDAVLKWIRKGQPHQTENGFLTIAIDGWYCPVCGGGYGKS